jgi:hypothetical protein
MDGFRLGPLSPCDSYRERLPCDSGDRKKVKRPKDQPAREDEVTLAESGAADPQAEGGAGTDMPGPYRAP